MKYLEGVWQKNKCGGISCLYLFKKKREKRRKEKEKERLYTKKIKSLKFQFKGVVGGVKRIVGELEFL